MKKSTRPGDKETGGQGEEYSVARQLGAERYATLLALAAERGFTGEALEEAARAKARCLTPAEPLQTAFSTIYAIQLAGLSASREAALLKAAQGSAADYEALLALRHPAAPVPLSPAPLVPLSAEPSGE